MSSTRAAGPSHPLSMREAEILTLVAQGHSAKEVARLIAIAPRTVERHLDNARDKLRARNRANLVSRAMFAGIIKPFADI